MVPTRAMPTSFLISNLKLTWINLWHPLAMSQLTLKDGRKLEYFENGVESDKAILLLHGTPSDGSLWSSWLEEIKDVRAISTSRAGYGLSDRHKGRTVADDLA